MALIRLQKFLSQAGVCSRRRGEVLILEGLVKRGAMPEPDSLEPWFFCRAHSQQDIDDTLTAFEDSAEEVLGAA